MQPGISLLCAYHLNILLGSKRNVRKSVVRRNESRENESFYKFLQWQNEIRDGCDSVRNVVMQNTTGALYACEIRD